MRKSDGRSPECGEVEELDAAAATEREEMEVAAVARRGTTRAAVHDIINLAVWPLLPEACFRCSISLYGGEARCS